MSKVLSDNQLMSRLQDGDLDALGILYERHKEPVYRTALAITCDPAAAEDILQDCFLRVHRYAHRFDNNRNLKPWLYRVTVNLAYNWETRRKRWQAPQNGVLEWLEGPAELTPEWQAEMNDIQRQVLKAVTQLSFNQGIAIKLYYLNSYSLSEIAQLLDCPVGTVKSRLHYGRENLYRQMKLDHAIN